MIPPTYHNFLSAANAPEFPYFLAAGNNDAVRSILTWGFGLLLLLVLLLGLVYWLRKWMSPAHEYLNEGFTLAQLRQLKQSGAMTQEEFEKAKALLIQGIQAAALKAGGGAVGGTGDAGATDAPPKKREAT